MSRRAEAGRVAIVGGGLAGTACALRLSERDSSRRITLYEQEGVGGTSARAIGSLTAAGTKWQRNAGVIDTPAEHLRTLLTLCEFDGEAQDLQRYRGLLRACCDAGAATLEMLAAWGLFFAGPFLEPPHPKPRMHNVVSSGAAMMALLRMRLGATRVELRERAAVLDIARNGAVFEVATASSRETFAALVVACGDRAARTGPIPALNPHATGRPIDMVEQIYGLLPHRPQYAPGLRAVAPGAPHIAPDPAFLAACELRVDAATRDVFLIVTEPQRFADEHVSTFPAIGYATLADVLATPLVHRRDPLELGPFRDVVSFVDGGLDVDESMHVLDAERTPIPHLYACGSAAVGGMRLEGHGHHLLWAAYSGSRAADALAEANEEQHALPQR
jgi:fumarate reductase flavoprotein subunit